MIKAAYEARLPTGWARHNPPDQINSRQIFSTRPKTASQVK
jgi:hypothetical protein